MIVKILKGMFQKNDMKTHYKQSNNVILRVY